MEIIRVTNREQLELCLSVRKNVFVIEQQVPESVERDEYDESPESCRHVLAVIGGAAVAAGRWIPLREDTVKMQRLAVLRDFRGQGIGRAVLQELEAWARDLQYSWSILDAQLHAESFYRKLGYAPVSGEVFWEAGMEHIQMKKCLQNDAKQVDK
ncbi:MAG TPA: GNAT family N-acetyltransferase [Bacilli bacterium]